MADSVTQANNKAVRFRGRPQKEYTRMPLESGKGPDVISRNISELHTGKTFAKTKARYGKRKAHKQSIAIAMSKAREMPDAGHNPPKPEHSQEKPMADERAKYEGERPDTYQFSKIKSTDPTWKKVGKAIVSRFTPPPTQDTGADMIRRRALRGSVQEPGLGHKPIEGAGHNPPKPTHAYAGKHVPRHMRGRGLISAKAMAAMGEHLAGAAAPWHGKKYAAKGKPHGAKPDAAAAQPEHGQHKARQSKPPHGKRDAAQA
jgi:hypothetical protein